MFPSVFCLFIVYLLNTLPCAAIRRAVGAMTALVSNFDVHIPARQPSRLEEAVEVINKNKQIQI